MRWAGGPTQRWRVGGSPSRQIGSGSSGRLSPRPITARIGRSGERVTDLHRRAQHCVLTRIARHRRHLDGCAKLLASLSYQGVLQRGYALVRDGRGAPCAQLRKLPRANTSTSSSPTVMSTSKPSAAVYRAVRSRNHK